MARRRSNLPSGIWKEKSFRELDRMDQWMYLMLCSSPDHNNLGVLPMTLNRWARRAGDLTPVECLDSVRSIAIRSWVVIDESTDELFIPRFMEFNHVPKQANMLRGAIAEVDSVWSPAIRLAIADVLEGIDRTDAQRAARHIREGTRLAFRERIPARPAIPSALRSAVYERDGWRCVYCSLQFTPAPQGCAPEDQELGIWLELDHIKPYSLGGEDTYENFRSACSTCNRKRGVDDADLWAGRMAQI